jgi:hypothetical protein
MYFELLGTLLAAYFVVRLAIGWEYGRLPPDFPRGKSTGPAGRGIDTCALSGRVEQLRQDAHAGSVNPSASFKKPLMVEERRREIEKRAFFQKAPMPEPPEQEEGVTLLFI